MGKEAGFKIEDRIITYGAPTGELVQTLTVWADYIKAETLSLDLVASVPPP
jgi:hypothetical protein